MRTLDSDRLVDYAKKWAPVVDGIFPSVKNPAIKRIVCYYCEWVSSDCEPGDLQKDLVRIKSALESFERIEVVGKFYNPATGQFEFKLANGSYVPIDTEFEYKLSDEDMIELFGIELLSKVDRAWARDHIISNIIKNG